MALDARLHAHNLYRWLLALVDTHPLPPYKFEVKENYVHLDLDQAWSILRRPNAWPHHVFLHPYGLDTRAER